MGYASYKSGDVGERIAMMALRRFGCHELFKIETPCKVVKGRKVYTEKARGDIVGQWHDGTGLLAEVKRWKDWGKDDIQDVSVASKVWDGWRKILKDHQRMSLESWSQRGRSVLVLVSGCGKYACCWLVNEHGIVSSSADPHR